MRNDYGDNRLSLRLAFRPLVDAFQFRGRSTRTEVVSFWLLGFVAGMIAITLTSDPPTNAAISTIWSALWAWPWIPLMVRRLHDQDRTGRWVLLNAARS